MPTFFAPEHGPTATTFLKSGCKINVGLKVLEPQDDGYHALETFFLPLTHPHDSLTITWQPTAPLLPFNPSNLRIQCSQPHLDSTNNTLTKAYTLYAAYTGFAPRLTLFLTKNVPIGGGLGGGSANAATFLQFLESSRLSYLQSVDNKNSEEQNLIPTVHVKRTTKNTDVKIGKKLENKELQQIALQVGADVPFFLLHKPAFATGIGQHLQLSDNPFAKKELLLVCPNIHINTAWAFATLDKERKNTKKIQKIYKKNLTYSASHDISSFACELHFENDFEEIVFKSYPELRRIKQYLLECGATHALMSGTGASVFGFFSYKEHAQEAMQGIAKSTHRVFLQTV